MILTGRIDGQHEIGDQIQVSLRLDEKPKSIDFRTLQLKLTPAEARQFPIGRKVKLTIEPQ